MELEEIQKLWKDGHQESQANKGLGYTDISQVTSLKYSKEAKSFRVGELIGLCVAYTLAAIILFEFGMLDTWYLRMCGTGLIIYLLAMPLYTIRGIERMKKIDLVNSNYREIMEHFHSVRSRLKQAERMSLLASPFLFFAAMLILTKIFSGINLFALDIQWPALILIGMAFLGAVSFNIWAFKKRENKLKSVSQLLEEGNLS